MSRFRPILILTLCLLPLAARAEAELMERLKFTLTEYLIYADQLLKLERSPCGQGAPQGPDLAETRARLLAPLSAADRQAVDAFLDAGTLQGLLAENSRGIEELLGAPDLTRTPDRLTEAQRRTCVEYRLIFQRNLDATGEDLDRLWQAYRDRKGA